MKYVLFVCTHNAGRSQMAQAFFERYAPADIRAESAGDEPTEAIWPNVVEAMHEVGIDISDRRPKRLDLEMQLHADYGVTLACGAECPYVAADVEEWDVPDPAGQSLAEVREIRDLIEERVKAFIAERLDDVRASATAHRLRLEKLLPSLDANSPVRTHPQRSAPALTPGSRRGRRRPRGRRGRARTIALPLRHSEPRRSSSTRSATTSLASTRAPLPLARSGRVRRGGAISPKPWRSSPRLAADALACGRLAVAEEAQGVRDDQERGPLVQEEAAGEREVAEKRP